MAYILEINVGIIDPKTKPKPFQNQLKKDNYMGC